MPKVKYSRKHRTIPYTKGFRPPTLPEQRNALGTHTNKAYSNIENHFQNIPKCTSENDWLAQYKEEGQTYDNFLDQTPWLSRRKMKYMKQSFNAAGNNLPEKYPEGCIYILPLTCTINIEGKAPQTIPVQPDYDTLVEYTQIFFGLEVRKLDSVRLEYRSGSIYWLDERPTQSKTKWHKMKSRYNATTGHYQLCIDEALLQLRGYMPDDGLALIALTMCDLYETRSDLFVAGMAAGLHRVAIFSLYRYNPNLEFSSEFWYQGKNKNIYKKEDRDRLILQRGCRLLVHEISHLLGVDHCIYYACCMNGSGHLEEDFTQPMYLCPVDLRKLYILCGFDIVQRYKKMEEFFRKYKLHDEEKWFINRVKFLEEDGGDTFDIIEIDTHTAGPSNKTSQRRRVLE